MGCEWLVGLVWKELGGLGGLGIGLLCVARYGVGSNLAVYFNFFPCRIFSKSWQFALASYHVYLYKSESIIMHNKLARSFALGHYRINLKHN